MKRRTVLMTQIAVLGTGLLSLVVAAVSAQVGAAKATQGSTSIGPCCAIASIDVRTGIVTARVNASRRMFQLKVTDATALRGLRVSQKVYMYLPAARARLITDGWVLPMALTKAQAAAEAGRNCATQQELQRHGSPGTTCVPGSDGIDDDAVYIGTDADGHENWQPAMCSCR